MQLLLSLNDNEASFLEEVTPEGTSRQALLRALLLHAKTSPKLLQKAVREARAGATIKADHDGTPGEKKGHSPQDYKDAVKEAGTLSGAARILDVAHTTVREQCIRHSIPVPSVGGVPQ